MEVQEALLFGFGKWYVCNSCIMIEGLAWLSSSAPSLRDTMMLYDQRTTAAHNRSSILAFGRDISSQAYSLRLHVSTPFDDHYSHIQPHINCKQAHGLCIAAIVQQAHGSAEHRDAERAICQLPAHAIVQHIRPHSAAGITRDLWASPLTACTEPWH